MNTFPRCFLPACLFLVCLHLPVRADGPPPPRKVTVNGTAIIKVAPDEMCWTVMVTINDASLAKAKARHDATLDSALKYLKGLDDSLKDLQTGGITFEKITFPGDDLEAKKRPFICATQITFILTDFSQYGPICDELAKLDGAQIQAVDYASSREAEIRRDALKRSLLDARDKAGDLASAADCTVDKPLSIEEQAADDVRPEYMNTALTTPAGRGTPKAVAGQIEFSAKVVVCYDLNPK